MTITANSHLPNRFPQNLESINHKANGLLATLGAELVYVQDGTGCYLSFFWQKSELLGFNPEQIVADGNSQEIFAPVDKVSYMERLHRVMTNLVPEKFPFWFACHQNLFELELVISPIMTPLGTAATTVLVIEAGQL